MAYKFTKSRQLRQLLDGAEEKQKRDIHDFSKGHLNESHLLQHHAAITRKPWNTAQKAESSSVSQCSSVPRQTLGQHSFQMQQTLVEFATGTLGVIPIIKDSNQETQSLKRYRVKKAEELNVLPEKKTSPSLPSLYSEVEDSILLEELPVQQVMFKKTLGKDKNNMWKADDTIYVTETLSSDQQPHQADHHLPLKYDFMSMHGAGITSCDQYHKIRLFETNILRKKDLSEQQVLSGVKAVEHHERKLHEELNALDLKGVGPNFHKLQVYSNSLEDIINESTTFSYILHCIKTEYDGYVAWLLDHQTSQQHLLREQVEQMTARGTSRPQEMSQVSVYLQQLTDDAKAQLDRNQRLRDEVKQQKEWLENTPDHAVENTVVSSSSFHQEMPLELAEEIEKIKALILEKLDEVNALRVQLREDYVPLTVCTHLEQCIKETEVEVQKLLKQNEYFERSIAEMESELKEAIIDADTSEKDARRIWRKVNSTRGMPGNPSASIRRESDEEDEEESKWNWYIS